MINCKTLFIVVKEKDEIIDYKNDVVIWLSVFLSLYMILSVVIMFFCLQWCAKRANDNSKLCLSDGPMAKQMNMPLQVTSVKRVVCKQLNIFNIFLKTTSSNLFKSGIMSLQGKRNKTYKLHDPCPTEALRAEPTRQNLTIFCTFSHLKKTPKFTVMQTRLLST